VPEGRVATTWSLYVLECEGGSLYTGIATDVARRYDQHCRGTGATYTRIRPPVRLLGSMQVGTRSAALKLEYAFKKLAAGEKLARAMAMAAGPAAHGAREEAGDPIRCRGNVQSDRMMLPRPK